MPNRKGKSKWPTDEEAETTSADWQLSQAGKRTFIQVLQVQAMMSTISWWESCLELEALPGAQ